jgi:hypothetical protein
MKLRATRSGAGLVAISAKTLPGMDAQQGGGAQSVASGGEPGGDWWATAEHLADAAQGAVGIELTTTARAVLVGMTAELLTVLTCWPNTVQPANALVYLRTRRARMARHVSWFYGLPRHVRWLLAGTDQVPSFLAFAVSTPTIDENASKVWRKALASLNGLAEPGGGQAPETSARTSERGQTGKQGRSDRSRGRRSSGCQRDSETAETAPRESATTATAARACGDSPTGRRCGTPVGTRPRRAAGANAQATRCAGSSAHGPGPASCGAQGRCTRPPTLGSQRRSGCHGRLSPRSSQPKTGRSPPLLVEPPHRGEPFDTMRSTISQYRVATPVFCRVFTGFRFGDELESRFR